MATTKTRIIEEIFFDRFDSNTRTLANALVTLEELRQAIRRHNQAHPTDTYSEGYLAAFFKDFIRNRTRANSNWPPSVLAAGFTARQVTGGNASFEFVQIAPGQTLPFPILTAAPTTSTPRMRVESVSLPLASRRLGRRDEPWLIQVLIRLRVIEMHFALVSSRPVVQVDHLQTNVKLSRAEIDALFLAIEESTLGEFSEVIVCCEAKGRRDDILEDQIIHQVQAVFKMSAVTQDWAIPIAAKALGPSEVYIVEFEPVARTSAKTLTALTKVSDAVYELVPKVQGIGQ